MWNIGSQSLPEQAVSDCPFPQFGPSCGNSTVNIKLRQSFDLKESPLCKAYQKYIFPQKALTVRGEYRETRDPDIVQSPSGSDAISPTGWCQLSL